MRLCIIHLSDLHFRTPKQNNTILGHMPALRRSIAMELEACDGGLVAITGDVAFSGLPAEYAIATEALENLIGELEQTLQYRLHCAVVPGNHDCDFTQHTEARSAILRGLGNTIDQAVVGAVTIQTAFEAFSARLSPPPPRTLVEPAIEARLYSFAGTSVGVVLINSAWMSSLPEAAGSLRFPMGALDVAAAESIADADMVIGLQHHPFNWFAPDDGRGLLAGLQRSCDLILTGHEHMAGSYRRLEGNRSHAEYLEGGALQTANAEQSGYNTAIVDFAERVIELRQYELQDGIYRRISSLNETREFQRNSSRLRAIFRLRAEVADKWDDTELPLSHPLKSKLTLGDLFVYPDIRSVTIPGAPRSDMRSPLPPLPYVLEHHKVFFLGQERSGKTALAKRLAHDLYSKGYVPIVARGEDLRARSQTQLDRKLEALIKAHYEAPASADSYFQVERSKRALVLDDYGGLASKLRDRDQTIERLLRRFGIVVLFGAHDARLDELIRLPHSSESAKPALFGFEHCEILQFGYSKRDELIERWILAAPTEEDDGVVRNRIARAGQTLDALVGNNLVPSYPVFLLLMLQQLELAQDVRATSGSHGFLYEAIITSALQRNARKVTDIEVQYSYLSEFAHFVRTRDRHQVSDGEFSGFHADFCKDRMIAIDEYAIRRALERTRVVVYQNGHVAFSYPYVRYYFTARYLAHHIQETETRSVVEELSSRLYQEDAANTMIFLAYLSRDEFILEAVLRHASSLFKEFSEFDISKDPPYLSKLVQRPGRLILDVAQRENQRRDDLAQRDEDERLESQQEPDDPEAITDPEIRRILDMNAAYKTVQIIGQILKSFPGALSGGTKVALAASCYGLGLRVLDCAISMLDGRGESIVEDLVRVATRYHPEASRERLTYEANALLYGIAERCAFGVVKHISRSVGLRELFPVFQKMTVESDNLSYKVVEASIKLEVLQEFPETEVLGLEPMLRGHRLAMDLLRHMVWYRFYLFDAPHAVRQRMCDRVGIE